MGKLENRILVEFESIPIFQNSLHTSRQEALNCSTGNLRLIQSSSSGLIYNDLFDQSLMTYETNYLSAAETSYVYREHLVTVADIVTRTLGTIGLIEIGCGQGYFLEALVDKGSDIRGYDPSYKGENPLIEKEYFKPNAKGPSKGLILRHILEHIADPWDFLNKLKDCEPNAYIYIEVPCFDWICKNKSWVDVFYEHVNYFRLSDFQGMFDNVIENGRLFGGQYLYLVAELASLKVPKFEDNLSIDFPSDFMNIPVLQQQYAPLVIWGGGAKGAMFAYHLKKLGREVDAVVDINPMKQGKFLPSTGVEIQSVERILATLPCGSSIYVMNERYIDEVKAITQNLYNYLRL